MIIDLTSFSPITTLTIIASNNKWHKTCRNDNTCRPTLPAKTPNRPTKYKRKNNADKLITFDSAKEIDKIEKLQKFYVKREISVERQMMEQGRIRITNWSSQ